MSSTANSPPRPIGSISILPSTSTQAYASHARMISRPRLRPTISRRIKYLTIAPRAEKKLQRESRRGEHDLRRLVGHANFLDDLVDSLDPQSEEDECDANAHQVDARTASPELDAELQSDHDSSTASDEDDWSDSSDDEDHALIRTESGVSIVNVEVARAAQQQTREAIAESDVVDYFSRPTKGSTDLMVTDRDITDLKDVNEVSVCEVASPLSDGIETPAVDPHGTNSWMGRNS